MEMSGCFERQNSRRPLTFLSHSQEPIPTLPEQLQTSATNPPHSTRDSKNGMWVTYSSLPYGETGCTVMKAKQIHKLH